MATGEIVVTIDADSVMDRAFLRRIAHQYDFTSKPPGTIEWE